MIITHNFYIDFLKSFNSFLTKRFLSPQAIMLSSQPIQKIEYNISSKTITTYQLYGNESYEYPNIVIDLLDIRLDEGISSIARNAYGLTPTFNTFELCYNETKNQSILLEAKRYFLNFNIRINLETSADMLNYYHVVTNTIPMNFTFVDYKFYYFIDISWIFNALQWHEDNNIINLVKDNHVINTDEASPYHYYSLFEVQPEFEFTSITKEEDKENMKYAINLNCVSALYIPFMLYISDNYRIDRIIINIDLNNYKETPILLDIDAGIYQTENIKKSFIISKNNFEQYTKIYNEGTSFEIDLDTYTITFDTDYNFNPETQKLGLYLISNYIDITQFRTYLPIENFEIEDGKIIIDPFDSDIHNQISSFFEQYNDLSMIILNVLEKN